MRSENHASDVFRALLSVSSVGNILGGISLFMLIATGVVVDPERAVPVVAVVIAAAMLIQGFYSVGYAHFWWKSRGAAASGALLAGQIIGLGLGIATIYYAIFYVERASNGGVEPGPFFSGAMIAANALLALILLASNRVLTPSSRARAGS